jgi:tetratricopeptide (TPR) repeat protein
LARAANLGEKTRATFQRGVVFYRLGQFQKALECFNSTLVAEPRNASALEYRARLRRDMGDGQGAVSDFRALIALRVYVNPGYYLAAAKLLAKSGDAHIPEAVSLLDDGIRDLGPVPQLQRYAIELELARNAPKAAIARLTSLAPSEGDGPEWQAQMGDLYLAAGDRPEAKLWWQKAQKTINQRRTTPAQTVLSQRLEANLKQY